MANDYDDRLSKSYDQNDQNNRNPDYLTHMIHMNFVKSYESYESYENKTGVPSYAEKPGRVPSSA